MTAELIIKLKKLKTDIDIIISEIEGTNKEPDYVTLEAVLKQVSIVSGVSVKNIEGDGRNRDEADARKLFAWWGHALGYSLREIGLALNRHYATMINNRNNFQRELVNSNKLKKMQAEMTEWFSKL